MCETKFKIGDVIDHFSYGRGVILGSYHRRGKYYYWHIKYDNDTYGYNRETSLRKVD